MTTTKLRDVWLLWEKNEKGWESGKPEGKELEGQKQPPEKDKSYEKPKTVVLKTQTPSGLNSLESERTFVPGKDKDAKVMQLKNEIAKLEEALMEIELTSTTNPVQELNSLLKTIAQEAEEKDVSHFQQELASKMKEADEFLTGKPHRGRLPYFDYAKQLLSFTDVIMHLADDGYSRLRVSLFGPPFLVLDKGNSLENVVNNWNSVVSSLDEAFMTPDTGTSVLGRSLFSGAALEPPNQYDRNFCPDPPAPEEGSNAQDQDASATLIAPKQFIPKEDLSRVMEAIEWNRKTRLAKLF
jgi:hypothetical protein